MPATIADVFRSNLFGVTSLTSAVNEIAYVPSRILEMGIFDVEGIPTLTCYVEKIGDTIALVRNSARGGPGQNVAIDRREAIPFKPAHLQLDDKLYADEVQDVRAFGSANQMEGIQQARDKRLGKMSRDIDLTLEYHALGALQGLVLDSDGTTVIDDLYDKFEISEPAATDMNLDAAYSSATAEGVIQKKCNVVTRAIDAELGGVNPSGYHAFCGDQYFDALVGHGEVRSTYLAQQEAAQLRGDSRRIFNYGNITWENYRGQGAVAITTTEARVFPLGVPDLFKRVFCPADYMEAVNTNGLPKYSKAAPDPSGFDKFVALEVQSNPVTYCTRPRVLRKLTLT